MAEKKDDEKKEDEKKEEEKKEDEKKEDEKKEDEKKEDEKKEDEKKEDGKKEDEKKEDGKKDDEKKPMSRDDYVSTMEGNCSKPCAPEYFGLVAKFDKKYFDKYPGRSCGELDTFIIKDCVKHGYDVKKFTAMCGYCIPSYNEAKFRFDIMMGPGDDPKKDDEKKEDE